MTFVYHSPGEKWLVNSPSMSIHPTHGFCQQNTKLTDFRSSTPIGYRFDVPFLIGTVGECQPRMAFATECVALSGFRASSTYKHECLGLGLGLGLGGLAWGRGWCWCWMLMLPGHSLPFPGPINKTVFHQSLQVSQKPLDKVCVLLDRGKKADPIIRYWYWL